MSNVLGELFGDIADAIREKTGDTATMKPAEFPEKIGGIDVPKVVENYPVVPDFSNGDQLLTAPDGYAVKSAIYKKPETLIPENIAEGVSVAGIVGSLSAGGGSGGGSLPAGLYLEFGKHPVPNQYNQAWFKYNGELYAITGTTSTGGNYARVYKFSGGVWNQIISSQFVDSLGYPSSWTYIEYAGKIHFFGRDKKYHYTFDGTTFGSYNQAPNNISKKCAFIQDNKLKVFSYSTNTVYVWDENTDTWTSEATLGASSIYFENVNGTIYATDEKKLCIYENGALTQITEVTGAPYNYIVAHNSSLYFQTKSKTTAGSEWFRYDTSLLEPQYVGKMPYLGDYCLTEVDGEFLLIFGVLGTAMHACVIHEVTATE